LCLAWDATGDVIVTGSADALRIWNVESGHAVHRMTAGRDERKKETIVWCLAVTKDFTIISGDSRYLKLVHLWRVYQNFPFQSACRQEHALTLHSLLHNLLKFTCAVVSTFLCWV